MRTPDRKPTNKRETHQSTANSFADLQLVELHQQQCPPDTPEQAGMSSGKMSSSAHITMSEAS